MKAIRIEALGSPAAAFGAMIQVVDAEQLAEAGNEKLEQARPPWSDAQGRMRNTLPAGTRDSLFATLPDVTKTTLNYNRRSTMSQSRIVIEQLEKSHEARSDEAPARDEMAGGRASRREFLGISSAALAAAAVVGGGASLIGGEANQMKAEMTDVSKDSATIAGEPLTYLATPNPEISSSIVTIPPGTTTEWMTHPVQGYLYVLEGTLTVEYAEGFRKEFKAGQGFPQARSKWHRGRNDGETPVRFLAVFFGGKDVPNVLNPPKSR